MSQTALGQVYQVYYPTPTTVYYASDSPAACCAPVTTCYAPSCCAPTCCAPTCCAPEATTAYYAPAPTTVYYAATPVVTTRYRPILGGTVTRTRYVYQPVTYGYPATVAYYPAW